MKLIKFSLNIFLILTFLFSCKNNVKYPYTLKDFRDEIRPYLYNIISRGIIIDSDSSVIYLKSI